MYVYMYVCMYVCVCACVYLYRYCSVCVYLSTVEGHVKLHVAAATVYVLIHCFCMLACFATWAIQFIRVTGRTTSTAFPSTIRTIGLPFVCCCKRIKQHKSVSTQVISFRLQQLAQSGLVLLFFYSLTLPFMWTPCS